MEEDTNFGEQLEVSAEIYGAEAHNKENLESQTSGSLGKFKDSTSLLNAYNELQSEFTRKCQKLSKFEQDDNVEQSTPFYESAEWKNNLSEFLKTHEDAYNLSKDISSEIINDKTLSNNKNGLELAYLRAKQKNYVDKNSLLKDESFLENYIFNNEKICGQIIDKYIKNLNNQAPTIPTKKGNTIVVPNLKPKDLNEARGLVELLFKD